MMRALIHEQRTEDGLARMSVGEHASDGGTRIEVIEHVPDDAVGRHREPIAHRLPMDAARLML